MVHAHVSDEYIYFKLMYMIDHKFHALLTKNMVHQYCEPTKPHKLATSKKPSVSNLHILLSPCVLQKETTHVNTKALNMRHQ